MVSVRQLPDGCSGVRGWWGMVEYAGNSFPSLLDGRVQHLWFGGLTGRHCPALLMWMPTPFRSRGGQPDIHFRLRIH